VLQDVGDFLTNIRKKRTTKTWDIMQQHLKFCGAEGVQNWLIAFKNNILPETFCPSGTPCEMGIKDHYQCGCLAIRQNGVKHYALHLGEDRIGLACVQLFGVVFNCCLAESIRKER
jgi:hypothetical protein